ncbi:MAG: hypothetical protein WBA74_11180, partial [Cyclobacteriaceae bacterium]
MGIDLTPELLDLIDRYLKGSLSEEERNIFLKKLAQDEALRQEVILQQQLFSTFNSEGHTDLVNSEDRLSEIREKLESKEIRDVSATIKRLGNKHHDVERSMPDNPKEKINYIIALAAAVVLLLVSVFLFSDDDTLSERYEAMVAWENLPSVIEKGGKDDQLATGERLFK